MLPITPDPESKDEKLNRLLRELHDSPGNNLERELKALGLSAGTFQVNTLALLRVVERFENAFPNPLMRPGSRLELWEYSFEVVRLFQNAIASGQSFLEHCRSTVERRYRKHDFLAEFIEYYHTCIGDSAACMFVKELRGSCFIRSQSHQWSRVRLSTFRIHSSHRLRSG